MAESAFEKVTREGISRTAFDAYVGGDSTLANAQLDIYPGGRPRPELSATAMYDYLVAKRSLAARFFKKQALAELDQPTEEIPVITPEMLEAAK